MTPRAGVVVPLVGFRLSMRSAGFATGSASRLPARRFRSSSTIAGRSRAPEHANARTGASCSLRRLIPRSAGPRLVVFGANTHIVTSLRLHGGYGARRARGGGGGRRWRRAAGGRAAGGSGRQQAQRQWQAAAAAAAGAGRRQAVGGRRRRVVICGRNLTAALF